MSDAVIVANGAPVKRRPGRPPALLVNPEIKDAIIGHILAGAYVETAFQAEGLSHETYYNWLEQAERGNPLFVDFVAALKKAEAKAELSAMATMRLGKEHFLPEATYLERRFRDRWGRSDKHQVNVEANIRVELVDYAKLAKLAAKKPPK